MIMHNFKTLLVIMLYSIFLMGMSFYIGKVSQHKTYSYQLNIPFGDIDYD